MKLGWSIEQISIRLPIDHKRQSISYEAIYQFVYFQFYRGGNGIIKKDVKIYSVIYQEDIHVEILKELEKAQKLERIGNLPSIEDRPSEVEKEK